MSLRVLLNDRALYRPRTGIGHYIAELTAAMQRVEPTIEFVTPYQSCLGREKGVRMIFPGRDEGRPSQKMPHKTGTVTYFMRRPPQWLRDLAIGSYNVGLKAIGRWYRCDLYHEPNNIPIRWHGPCLTTVHDLSVLRHPEWHPADRVHWYEREFRKSLDRVSHFITVSQFTRQEMIDLLGVDPQRITVIPLGPRAVFQPRDPAQVSHWLKSHGYPTQYVLTVGTIEPRKNLTTTLAAYAALPNEYRQRFPLLIAGGGGWGDETVDALIERHSLCENVHVLGYVEDEALAHLYAGARVLVWPALYEGFGLPPLEAMACATPVITSNTTAIPEVTANAATLVDPQDTDAIRDTLLRVLDDDAWAGELATKGLARSRTYSWDTCAKEHAKLYRLV